MAKDTSPEAMAAAVVDAWLPQARRMAAGEVLALRIAALIRRERSACARLAENLGGEWADEHPDLAGVIAKAIHARNKKPRREAR